MVLLPLSRLIDAAYSMRISIRLQEHVMHPAAHSHLEAGYSSYSYRTPFPRKPLSYHLVPHTGPLWDVITQKVLGGSLANGSELVMEVAEARLANVQVHGSLLVSWTRLLCR